jgi:hypothetical protein
MSDNLPEVERALLAYQKEFDIKLAAAADEISIRLEGLAKREIKGRRPKGQKAITGQPPMNRTGNLRRSIVHASERKGFAKYEAIVGAEMVYARAVEMGSPYNPPSWQNGQKFPFLQPAVDKAIKSNMVQKILAKHLGAK